MAHRTCRSWFPHGIGRSSCANLAILLKRPELNPRFPRRVAVWLCRARADQASQTSFHVSIRGIDQRNQGGGVDLDTRFELYVTHTFAIPFEQTCRVLELGAKEEADVYVSLVNPDVTERCITNTRRGTPIVHELSDVASTSAEQCIPPSCD